MPIQKYQYCGAMPENWSRATMKIAAPGTRVTYWLRAIEVSSASVTLFLASEIRAAAA